MKSADTKAPVDPNYPAERYHATEDSRVVRNAAEEAALGPDWFDSPKKAKAKRVKK